MTTSYQTIWFPKQNICKLKTLDFKPKYNPDTILIKSKYSLISQGSEKLFFQGNVPASTQQSMIVPYQLNNGQFPCNYGYSLVGQVVEGPSHLLNQHVHVLHPHTSMAQVSSDDCTIIPPSIDLRLAPLISQIQTAITAIWDSKVTFGEHILIAGFGLIGACIAGLLSQRKDMSIYIIEPNEYRANLAASLGFNLLDTTDKNCDIDVAFYCTNNPGSLSYVMQQLCHEGKLVHCAWHGNHSINVNLGDFFHTKRLQWISSQVSHIPSYKSKAWTTQRRNQLALKSINLPIFSQIPQSLLPFLNLQNLYEKHLIDDHLIQLITYE